MEDKQGLTMTSLLIMAIIEGGDDEDIRKTSLGVSNFPPELADKYWTEALKIADIFTER